MSEAELKDWQARQYPILRARVAELEEGISTAMQLIEGGFDSAAYEALEALNAHK